MSSGTHNDHASGGMGPGPTNFVTKYVFSTDHKVIGLQFTFASLIFVIVGGLLALGVRYQLAWPKQDVPFAKVLPGKMTSEAPEANIGLWHDGGRVRFAADYTQGAVTIPKGAEGAVIDFPQGFNVTVPAGTRVQEADRTFVLTAPVTGFINRHSVVGDDDYTRQLVQTRPGAKVTTAPGEGGQRVYSLVEPTVVRPGGTEAVTLNEPLRLAVNAAATAVTVRIPSQAVAVEGALTSVSDTTVTLPASAVQYPKQTLTTDAYVQLFTMHATIMVFFVMMPMLMGGFGNFLIPLMIGARDMAFPKLNMLSFWLAVPSGVVIMLSFFTMGGPAGGGWTMYPTLSEPQYSTNIGTTLWLVAIGLVGFSTIVGTLNYITTIINMRAPGMTMFRMPLTIWSLFITSVLALFATPVLTAAAILMLLDRTIGTHFFNPITGGQPLLWQHLFWFFGHPEVYILILPTMGIASDVISTFARKPIFGYKPMVFAICTIAGLGFIVWGHHMFQSGMNPALGFTFSATTMMIALPSAIKVFNWLGTLWGGNIRFTPAMLNALGFVSMFVIGGLSGIFMASAPVDVHIHDTYFIVAHIHYVLFGGTMFGIFAGVYYWYPKMFGTQMNQRWGVIHFVLTIIAFNGTFFLMHILGVGGHPRRYASILEFPTLKHLQPMNVAMTLFALSLGLAQIPFFYNFFVSLPRKLGRAITCVFVVALSTPYLMYYLATTTFVKLHADSTLAINHWFDSEAYPNALGATMKLSLALTGAAAVYAAVVVAVVFAIWFVGGKLRLPAVLQRVLYIVILPMFLMPFIVKSNVYIWLGVPELYPYRCWLLALLAVPGLVYLVVRRPRDEFGYAVGDNPWEANSLEWVTTSPPLAHGNFETIPTVYRGPYEYSSPAVEEDFLPQPRELPPGVVEPTGH